MSGRLAIPLSRLSREMAWVGFGAILVVILAGALAAMAVRTQEKADVWVAHTHEVIARLEGVQSAVSAAESAQRAYLLTGAPGQRAAFEEASQRARAELDAVQRLTADNHDQQARLPVLRAAIERRLDSLATGIALREQSRLSEAIANVSGHGIGQMDAVRRHLSAMRAEEDQLLDSRLQSAETAAALGVTATVGTSALAVLLLLALYRLSTLHTRRLRAEQAHLRESREQTRQNAEQLRTANERLQAFAIELERRVDDRTAELADANDELESFVRTVAHDLRAPLRNIQGYATALLEDEAARMSEDGRDYTQRLVGTTQRLDTLVTDLLAYSRVARSQLQLEAVELAPLVREVLNDIAPDIAVSGGTVDVAEPLPSVVAHRAMLAQILANLVGNALKFVAAGSVPRVHIGAKRDGNTVVLSVADEGIGIPAEHHERVFHVFERLHGQERYPGTGIGLAIARKGVERMGGTITVASRPDGGSRFDVRLKAAAEPSQ
ncbi:CHASE3 domain-containing protein [Lysobacter korlensis]|uniref:histidine kinase n=1 Tax=Lysobacter korlensis TaxID=553636 RepID=A0ABV6RN64_9GAMM